MYIVRFLQYFVNCLNALKIIISQEQFMYHFKWNLLKVAQIETNNLIIK